MSATHLTAVPALPTEEEVRIHGALVTAELKRLARLQEAFTNLADLSLDLTARMNVVSQECIDAARALKELREQHS